MLKKLESSQQSLVQGVSVAEPVSPSETPMMKHYYSNQNITTSSDLYQTCHVEGKPIARAETLS
jgi:hypothetical protein